MTRWNAEQERIIREFRDGARPFVVRARAGCGKTTILIEGVRQIDRRARVLVCAFNKRIRNELFERAPRWVKISTLHQMGAAALMNAACRDIGQQDDNKTRRLIRMRWGTKHTSQRITAMASAVSFAKNTLADGPAAILELVDRFDIDIGMKPREATYKAELAAFADDVMRLLDLELRAVLDRLRSDKPVSYNYDDMCWVPVRAGLALKQYDHVVVDEAQDMNACQHALARAAAAPSGRRVLVLDDRQMIYGWRGADPRALEAFLAETGAEVLPLCSTFRCGRQIVELAREEVDDYRASDGNPEGAVEFADEEEMLWRAQPGDAIISRKNAPLVRICLRLLARGKPAAIAGRKDLGAGALGMIDAAAAAGATTASDLVAWVNAWLTTEVERLRSKDPPGSVEAATDRAACIRTLADGLGTLAQVRHRVDDLFADRPDEEVILLTSTHGAKGLEWDRVWMLEDTYARGASREESNLWYVAVTRARLQLLRVRGIAAQPSASAAEPPRSSETRGPAWTPFASTGANGPGPRMTGS